MSPSIFDNPDLTQQIHKLHAEICSALADPLRILILYALAEQPYTVNSLAEKMRISQPTTSRHLKILRTQGLVYATRQGMNVEYTLNDHRLIDALDLLRLVLRDNIASRANLLSKEG